MRDDLQPTAAANGSLAGARVLQARAVALARPPEPTQGAGTVLDLLEFRLARERYAVEIRYVREVCGLKDLTPLPCTPPFVLGIVNLRGRVLPIFDLGRILDLPEAVAPDLRHIILVHERDLEFGLLADAIAGVRSIAAASLQPSLPTLTGMRNDYLRGVTAERLVVLDLARLLADPKIIVHQDVED